MQLIAEGSNRLHERLNWSTLISNSSKISLLGLVMTIVHWVMCMLLIQWDSGLFSYGKSVTFISLSNWAKFSSLPGFEPGTSLVESRHARMPKNPAFFCLMLQFYCVSTDCLPGTPSKIFHPYTEVSEYSIVW